jgi:hypothetical protein
VQLIVERERRFEQIGVPEEERPAYGGEGRFGGDRDGSLDIVTGFFAEGCGEPLFPGKGVPRRVSQRKRGGP